MKKSGNLRWTGRMVALALIVGQLFCLAACVVFFHLFFHDDLVWAALVGVVLAPSIAVSLAVKCTMPEAFPSFVVVTVALWIVIAVAFFGCIAVAIGQLHGVGSYG